jgi:hypothetical protein
MRCDLWESVSDTYGALDFEFEHSQQKPSSISRLGGIVWGF